MRGRFPFVSGVCGVIAATLLFTASDPAGAGAWPRGEGKTFFSLSHTFELGDSESGDYSSLFYEYGLNPDLTAGIDAGVDPADMDPSAIFFLRHPVFRGLETDLFAIEFGIGWANLSDDGRVLALRPGFSWGRGYSTEWASGWLGIETSFAVYDGGSTLGKLDATVGVSHESGSLSILQLQLGRPSGEDLTAALAPSHVLKLTDRSSLELGGTYRLDNGDFGLKLGYWFAN